MLYPPHFREIGTVSGWEKLQIHAKEDVRRERLQLARASLRSDFDSISDTRYLDSRRACEEGEGNFSNSRLSREIFDQDYD